MEDELLKFLKAGFCSNALNKFFSKGNLNKIIINNINKKFLTPINSKKWMKIFKQISTIFKR